MCVIVRHGMKTRMVVTFHEDPWKHLIEISRCGTRKGFLCFFSQIVRNPCKGCLNGKSNEPNPVTIKNSPNKHGNPFAKTVDDLWLGYELGSDEYWEESRTNRILNHVKHTENPRRDTDRQELVLGC